MITQSLAFVVLLNKTPMELFASGGLMMWPILLVATVGATVIIEQIYTVPGVGSALLQGINTRDVPLVEGTVLIFALVVVAANLLTDLVYGVLDPRIRYGRTSN